MIFFCSVDNKAYIESYEILHDFGFTSLLISYDVAVIQWITSCHKNTITTRVITFWRLDITSMTTSVSKMRLLEILSTLKGIKFSFKGACDKQNLILVVISYEKL